ncbi:hypothetical protein AGMMS50284_1880 [Clostridia bacterium]|nr:hypothetical protein AGMMS50284_1880 [Clostridia bacterium]
MHKKIKITKVFAVLLSLIAVTALLAGCGATNVRVETLLQIDKAFNGERTITCYFGKDFAANDDSKSLITEVINETCPKQLAHFADTEAGEYKYTFTLAFASLQEYKEKLEAVLNRPVSVVLATPNSSLANGWALKEDFDGMELIKWLQDELAIKGYKNLNLTFESVSNVVNYGGDIVSSKTTELDINEIKGYPVNSISVETTNNKNGSYDRKITISVPQSTYDTMGGNLSEIMEERTDTEAVYNGWSQQGNYQEYQVLYQGISIKELQRLTNLFMDNYTADIYYGDENKSSTPLAEQLVFEENINILSFVPQEKKPVTFNYKYSLPIKTTHGTAVVFEKGTWDKQGDWVDGVYILNSENYTYDIRIPDGMQYTIKGIDVNLTTYDNNTFKRTFDFVYDTQQGDEGINYAIKFLTKKGLEVTKEPKENGTACRITQNGTAQDISRQLGDLFGGGNFITYSKKTSKMAVVTDINVSDSINIAYMLTGDNTDVPFTYTVSSSGYENIGQVTADNHQQHMAASPKIIGNADGTYTAKMTGGENVISYVATVPYSSGVITYCVIAGAMLIIAALLIVYFFKKTKKLLEKEREIKLIAGQIESRET